VTIIYLLVKDISMKNKSCDFISFSFIVYIQPIGSIFTILGLLFVGPSSYIPEFDWIVLPNHYVSIVGLSLMGIGTAALLVSH